MSISGPYKYKWNSTYSQNLLSILNPILTDPTLIHASLSKGKKVVGSSSSIDENEKSNDEAKNEKTTSSIQKNEV
jgi:hypothetical protein